MASDSSGNRRRNNDSSSSRESSPQSKKQKRSFTPMSDDGTVVPEVQDEEPGTPPPPAATATGFALIREPVAFAPLRSAASVNMYQAEVTVPRAGASSLPGEDAPAPAWDEPPTSAVRTPLTSRGTTSPSPSPSPLAAPDSVPAAAPAPPPPVEVPSTTATKKKIVIPAPKKRRKPGPTPSNGPFSRKHANNGMAAHTNTWRVKGYVRPTIAESIAATSSVPMLDGRGPYSSAFRSVPGRPIPIAPAPAGAVNAASASSAAPSPAPVFASVPPPISTPATPRPVQSQASSVPATTTRTSNSRTRHLSPSPSLSPESESDGGTPPAIRKQRIADAKAKAHAQSLNQTQAQSQALALAQAQQARSWAQTQAQMQMQLTLQAQAQARHQASAQTPSASQKAPAPPSSMTPAQASASNGAFRTDVLVVPPKPPTTSAQADASREAQTQALKQVPGPAQAHPISVVVTPTPYTRLPTLRHMDFRPHFVPNVRPDFSKGSPWTVADPRDKYCGEAESIDLVARAVEKLPSVSTDSPKQAVDPLRKNQKLRMLTLLIVDGRAGQDDHQLAEVKVPLRPADPPHEGYWADAKDVCEQLQAGPSRIDGPAKVYTLRGKYRQFFLRVTDQGVDDCTSANLLISRERTLDVIVELPPSVGKLPLPPKIPLELIHEYDMRLSPSSRAPPEPSALGLTIPQPHRHSRPGLDRTHPIRIEDEDYDMGHAGPSRASASSVPRRSSYGSPAPSPSSSRSETSFVRGKVPMSRSNGNVDTALVRFVTAQSEPEQGWAEFSELRDKVPQTVGAVLKMYRYVKSRMDDLVGIKPFPTLPATIGQNHVLAALDLDEEWYKTCAETLRLLEWYGPGGRRAEDSRVVAMVNDDRQNMRRLQRMLREIDADRELRNAEDG